MKIERRTVVFGGVGLILLLTGLSTQISSLTSISSSIAFFIGAFILGSQITWKSLIDKKVDDKDVISVIALVMTIVLAVAGFIVALGKDIPNWLSPVIPYVLGAVGLLIIIKAIRDN